MTPATKKSASFISLLGTLVVATLFFGRIPPPAWQSRFIFITNAAVGILSAVLAVRHLRFKKLSLESPTSFCYAVSLPSACAGYFFYNCPTLSGWRWEAGSLSFLIFGLSTLTFLAVRFASTLKIFTNKDWILVVVLLGAGVWLQWNFIVSPMRQAGLPLGPFAYFCHFAYRLAFAAILSLAIPLSVRVLSFFELGYLLTLIFLHGSGFGWAYRFATTPITITNWAWQIWNVSILLLLAFTIASQHGVGGAGWSRHKTAEWKSVRSVLAVTLFAGQVITLIGFIVLDVLSVADGVTLSSVSAIASLVWGFANIIGAFAARRLGDIGEQLASCSVNEPHGGVGRRKVPLADLKIGLTEHDRVMESAYALRRELEERTREAAIGQLAAQISHDIRSPLAALSMILPALDACAEETRIIAGEAVQRITDIAQELLSKERARMQHDDDSSDVPQTTLLLPLLERVTSEKRVQVRGAANVQIDLNTADLDFDAAVVVHDNALKRALSNVLNNAVEACGEGGEGRVEIIASTTSQHVHVAIVDNGPGFPAHLLSRIGERGVTYGKPEGTGLGLYQAKGAVEAWGGTLSTENHSRGGSKVAVVLPRADPPGWFLRSIDTRYKEQIVVLDDDSSIHCMWATRFKSAKQRIVHVKSVGEFEKCVATSKKIMHTLFLMDHELIGSAQTGLDLIASWKLTRNAILVTSSYQRPEVVESCRSMNVKIIPKPAAARVPIV